MQQRVAAGRAEAALGGDALSLPAVVLVARHRESRAQRLRQRGTQAEQGGGQRVGQARGGELRGELR